MNLWRTLGRNPQAMAGAAVVATLFTHAVSSAHAQDIPLVGRLTRLAPDSVYVRTEREEP
ncbi:hypothetical protein BH18GEM1_BH18GEM1_10860 [soil metagenome]